MPLNCISYNHWWGFYDLTRLHAMLVPSVWLAPLLQLEAIFIIGISYQMDEHSFEVLHGYILFWSKDLKKKILFPPLNLPSSLEIILSCWKISKMYLSKKTFASFISVKAISDKRLCHTGLCSRDRLHLQLNWFQLWIKS